MKIETTDFPGVIIITKPKFEDLRGYFAEMYKKSEYSEYGIPDLVQDNLSRSHLGVIRGMHWQQKPFEQGKLVTCIQGSIQDVIVDINRKSKTYGEYIEIFLHGDDDKLVWIPGEYAHGFQSLEENSLVHYKVSNEWNKNSEQSFNPLDQTVGISWKMPPTIISEKDSIAPRFTESTSFEIQS